jgi:hypothetical protein
MIMTGRAGRAPGPVPRLARMFLGRNELRRPCDRVEGAILVALSAAFLTVIVLAGVLAGHLYKSERAAAAGLRPALAVLSAPGPVVAGLAAPSGQVQAQAVWRLAGGAERSGVLTAGTAPAIDDAGAGATVTIWLNRAGVPQPPPPSQDVMVANALGAGALLAAGAGALLAACYRLCRRALDRRRLARWGQAWAATGPRWTSYH